VAVQTRGRPKNTPIELPSHKAVVQEINRRTARALRTPNTTANTRSPQAARASRATPNATPATPMPSASRGGARRRGRTHPGPPRGNAPRLTAGIRRRLSQWELVDLEEVPAASGNTPGNTSGPREPRPQATLRIAPRSRPGLRIAKEAQAASVSQNRDTEALQSRSVPRNTSKRQREEVPEAVPLHEPPVKRTRSGRQVRPTAKVAGL
jgi:hypothetical protein